MRWFLGGISALLLAAGGGAVWLWLSLGHIETEQLSEDLWLLHGLQSGNVAVLATGEGAVVVDTMISPKQGEIIRQKAQELTGEAVTLVINTHYHLDHSFGNPAFEPGTRVAATERTLHHMTTVDANNWRGSKALLLPNELVRESRTLRIGEKTLRLINPGRGHTDGDLVVLFEDERVVHTGDLFFNRMYPNIDLEAGGSVQAWGDTLDRVLALPFDRVIPGHGPVTDTTGLRQFQAFIRQLAELGRHAASTEANLTDTLVNGWLTEDAGYQPIGIPLIMQLDRDFVITRAWEEATGTVDTGY